MKRIEAIIFDKDGTLFDFQATWSGWAQAVLADLAGQDEGAFARAAGAIGFDPAASRFLPGSVALACTTAEVAEALAPHFPGRDDLVAVLDTAAARAAQVPVPDLHATLDRLAPGRRLGVVTNDSEVPARAHLAAAGIAEHFDFVAGYDSGHGAKPDPGPLLAFSDAVGIAPERTLMVGDSRHDLLAGRRAGMATVAVPGAVADGADLADLADAILPGLAHLPGLLASRSGN